MSLRANLGLLLLEVESLCGIVVLMGSLNWTVFMVFLMPLGGELPQEGCAVLQGNKGIPEVDAFSSLLQAAWPWGVGDGSGIYSRLHCVFRDLEF